MKTNMEVAGITTREALIENLRGIGTEEIYNDKNVKKRRLITVPLRNQLYADLDPFLF